MLWTSMAMAVPAHPGLARITQPDGSMLTVRLLGDEYLHFYTTEDGYSIVRRSDGFYAYAQHDDNGQLIATERIAHDSLSRADDERAWLQGVKKYLTPKMSPSAAREQQAEFTRRAQARQAASAHSPVYDYNNFHGLIILVQYNDREFSRDDYASLMEDMVNKENYQGYDNTQYGRYTGSVRDYFYDNSFGVFSPQFDIVGPITVNYSQYYPKKYENMREITYDAIMAANPEVDYSQYDGDGDGVVDLIYFIFAGLGSNVSGNDERLIWPHTSYIYNPYGGGNGWQVKVDGVYMGRYACSTELLGSSEYNIIDGIGTICHEFSHVLGVMDLYDTDYEGSGGECPHPDDWSVMSGGSYLNNSRTPVGYTIYERYAMGFATPQLISDECSCTLEAVSESNTGYRLNTPVKKEFFLMENRQQTAKWDKYLPGHGLLVYRVDSTSNGVWQQNTINVNPKHMYFEVVRAGGTNEAVARASDPFPGSNKITTLNNSTSPANLLTWAKKPNTLGLDHISEKDGIITFDVIDVNTLKSISLPAEETIGYGLSMQLTETRFPDYAPYTLQWSSSNPSVVAVDNNGVITGMSLGRAYITVVANGDPQLTATCHVTVEDRPIATSIAAFKALPDGMAITLLLNDALVVFTHGTEAYVRDATGAIVFSGTNLKLSVGDRLNGNVYGKLSIVDKMPLFKTVDQQTTDKGYTVTPGNEVLPREISLSDVTEADYGDLITLKATSLVYEPKVAVWAVDKTKKVRLYNTFQLKNISISTDVEGKWYDVTGIFHTNKMKGMSELIDEIAMTEKPREVDAPPQIDAIASLPADDSGSSSVAVYTTDGRLVAKTTIAGLAQLSLSRGLYVARTANRAWRFAKN